MTEPIERKKDERIIVYSDGSRGTVGDFPVAVTYTQHWNEPSGDTSISEVVDPIFNDQVVSNLYGRILTLVEATADSHKLEPVKDLFRKEIGQWSSDVYRSAREVSTGGDSSENIYTRHRHAVLAEQ